MSQQEIQQIPIFYSDKKVIEMIEKLREKLEISRERVLKLIEQALESPTESKFLLKIIINIGKYGDNREQFNDFEIVSGKAKVIDLGRTETPFNIFYKYIILPDIDNIDEEPIVVVEEIFGTDRTEPGNPEKYLYIFSSEGWKKVRVY